MWWWWFRGFPGGSVSKESACNAGEGSVSGSGRSAREGNGSPLQSSAWETPWTEDRGKVRHCHCELGKQKHREACRHSQQADRAWIQPQVVRLFSPHSSPPPNHSMLHVIDSRAQFCCCPRLATLCLAMNKWLLLAEPLFTHLQEGASHPQVERITTDTDVMPSARGQAPGISGGHQVGID